METRKIGQTGIKVPLLCMGTATFGGTHPTLRKWGNTQLDEARLLIHTCLEKGINFFDTADIYSDGIAEEFLGSILTQKRHEVIISTKGGLPMSKTEYGSSATYITSACEASLKRLHTDYIDIYHIHGFDDFTPVEETLEALHNLVQSGKVRAIGCSNFSAWQLMKSLSIAEKNNWARYSVHQVYYSLLNREYEYELMPLGIDQQVSGMVWSPLAGGRLTGKIKRHQPAPPQSRLGQGGADGPYVETEKLYEVVDVLEKIATEKGKTISQIAINWLLQKPGITSVVMGARTLAQMTENIDAAGWSLTTEEMNMLDTITETPLPYPYWHQRMFPMLHKKT